MASVYSIFNASGVRIEVEGGAAHIDYGSDFVKSMKSIVSMLTTSLSEMEEGERPNEISMTFGLSAISGGGFAVSLGMDKANFQVHFSWGKSNEPGLPGLDIFPQGETTGPG